VATLEFPVTTIPGEGLGVDVVVTADALRPAHAARIPLEQVAVRGDLSPMVGQFLFRGTVEAVFVHPCDRCLEEAVVTVAVPVVWTFEEETPGETESSGAVIEDCEEEACGVFTFDGTVIDLARPAWDEAGLALPVKFLCHDECRGLCPVCGINRNRDRCACEVSETEEAPAGNSGFAGLKDLFPDLPDGR